MGPNSKAKMSSKKGGEKSDAHFDMDRPSKRTKLLSDDSGSEESDSGGPGGVLLNGDGDTGSALKINEEYARRFEHNKKREELHRLEEKFGKDASTKKRKAEDDESEEDESDSSDSESEDDEGILATEDLDAEISATLQAIRSKDPKVYNKSSTFYKSIYEEQDGEVNEPKKEKPMFLTDYHRQNLLEGHIGDEETEALPKTYSQVQEDLKQNLVKEMHAAVDAESAGEDEEDDDFLIAKGPSEPDESAQKPSITETDIQEADKDPEKFLSNFLAARAWVPTSSSRFQPLESDDEDDDKRADAFEEAYNFRFEDPALANEKLISHSREAAAKYSVRREEMSGRKKQRELERAKREEEKRERQEEKARLRKLKIEEMAEKIQRIKEAAGLRGKVITEDHWADLLEGDWEDDKWENEMNKKFGEAYYEQDDNIEADGDGKQKKPKKPKWDDDIDINDLVPEFDGGEHPEFSLSDESDEDAGVTLNGAKDDVEMEDAIDPSAKPKSKKDRLKEQADKKKQARKERQKIEELVDEKLDLDMALPASSKKTSFRYRETSPQAYGLTSKDILMASDSQLNQFVGLKKLATFRDPTKKQKDRKKLGKKARLRLWRKETFGNPDGPSTELVDMIAAQRGKSGTRIEATANGDAGVDIREGKKKRKRSKKGKGQQIEA